MNEIFDKLLLRFIFAAFILVAIYLYRFAHNILYNSSSHQILHHFNPSRNSSETIHLFMRLIGLAIVYSEFYFFLSSGLIYALFDFLLLSFIGIVLYLLSIYVIESILFYNFEYQDEIHKRKNLSYAIISGVNAISAGLLIKSIISVAHDNIIILFFLWLFSLVLIGFTARAYISFSKFSFNKMLLQKSHALTYSYVGYLFGWTFIITEALKNDISNIRFYIAQVLLRIILCLILIPLISKGILRIFKIENQKISLFGIPSKSLEEASLEDVGKGIYEGAIFFVAAYFSLVIAGNLNFGNFYP